MIDFTKLWELAIKDPLVALILVVLVIVLIAVTYWSLYKLVALRRKVAADAAENELKLTDMREEHKRRLIEVEAENSQTLERIRSEKSQQEAMIQLAGSLANNSKSLVDGFTKNTEAVNRLVDAIENNIRQNESMATQTSAHNRESLELLTELQKSINRHMASVSSDVTNSTSTISDLMSGHASKVVDLIKIEIAHAMTDAKAVFLKQDLTVTALIEKIDTVMTTVNGLRDMLVKQVEQAPDKEGAEGSTSALQKADTVRQK